MTIDQMLREGKTLRELTGAELADVFLDREQELSSALYQAVQYEIVKRLTKTSENEE